MKQININATWIAAPASQVRKDWLPMKFFIFWVLTALFSCVDANQEKTKEASSQIEKPTKETTKSESEQDEPIDFDPLKDSASEEILVYKELSKRSKEIAAREKALRQQTLLLKAAQISMNEKVKNFDLLKQDLLKLLNKIKEKDDKQIDDLVKVYSAMKPKNAAGILNQVEMTILKEIVKRMGKKKAALILAAMDAKKAKDLTQNLAKEGQNLS